MWRWAVRSRSHHCDANAAWFFKQSFTTILFRIIYHSSLLGMFFILTRNYELRAAVCTNEFKIQTKPRLKISAR